MGRTVAAFLLVSCAGPAFAQEVLAPGDRLKQALALVDKGEDVKALPLLESLQGAALEPLARARLHQALAVARSVTGQYDAALRSADECERLAQGLKAYDLLARIEGTRGFVWGHRGFSDRALQHYRKGLEWAEVSGSKRDIAVSLGRLAQGYQAVGDWPRILYCLQRQFELDPNPSDEARLHYLSRRGIAQFEFHDRNEAEKSFRDALAIARRLRSVEGIAFAAYELGWLYWTFDRDRERALRLYREALAEATRGNVPHFAVLALNNIGNVHRDSGEPALALASYERGLAVARRHGDAKELPFLLKNSGTALVQLGRREAGERRLLEAMGLADEQGNQRLRWQARMELAQLYRGSDPPSADRYFAETLDVIEAAHNNVLLDDLRAANLAVSLSFYDPYDLYIGFLLEQKRPADALRVAERARARAFLATLSAAREQIAGAVPAKYLESEKEILRRISEQQTTLRTKPADDTQRQELVASIQRDEERLTALRVRLAADRPQLAQARYPHLRSVEELQKQVLRPREAFAVFFLGKEASVCWLVTRERLETVSLPARAEVESAVRASLDTLRSPRKETRDAARRLYDMIGAPLVEKVPEGWRLVVVPHGVLNYLPLETALDARGRYLIERHPVSYAPSVASIAYLRSLPAEPSTKGDILLAVGDPVVGEGVPAAERALDPALLGLLKPLAHGAEELRRITSIFGSSSRVLDRARATEAELGKVDGRRVRVLHFATHGLVDDQRPDRSALALTAEPPHDDGLLQTREVFRLRLGARLVTLSACQTALGKELTGEGLVGLARAFFYAGANAVMASLWSVSDASTARWMADFYGQLRDGAAIDEAARAAKLGFIRSGTALAHPYHWAPFIVTGNAAVGVDLPRPSYAPRLAAAAAVTALGVGAYLIVLRRRRRTRDQTS